MTAFHIEPMNSSPSWNWRLGAGDARRAVLADRGHRLVLVGVEALLGRARRARERRRRIRTRKPWRARVPRAARGVHRYVENDQHVRMADRLRELIDVVLGSLDEPVERGVAGGARALLARPPGPAAGARRRASRRWRCGGGCCSSGRRGSCARARRRASEAAAGAGLRVAGGVLARVRARLRRAAERVRGRGGAGGAERHPLPPARGAADPGRRDGRRRTSPTGSSRTTSTACASCSPRRPRFSDERRCGSELRPGSSRSGSRGWSRARR